MLVAALLTLHRTETGYELRRVLAFDLPTSAIGFKDVAEMDFYHDMARRIDDLPGVDGAALGVVVRWRDAGRLGPGFQCAVDGWAPEDGEEHPHARFRVVSPGFFDVLGVPLIAGRDFDGRDRSGAELVVIVSESLAARLFPNGRALDRTMWWTDPYFGKPQPRRIVGVVADVDDEQVVPGPALTVYHPVHQMKAAGRLFVRAAGEPDARVSPVTRLIREMSPDQPVERAATLEDIRAEILAPERVNAFVVSGFAGIALLVAVVGVSGVLAFSVSVRTREFGVLLAVGSSPGHLLRRVLAEGMFIVATGIVAGAVGGYAFAGLAAVYLADIRLPGAIPIVAAAAVLTGAAVLASLVPAARASRVDVLQALRSE
jgi:hypothetical protein